MRLSDVEVLRAPDGRDGWTFAYRASDVSVAARARAEYHDARRVYWETEATRLEAELRDSGIELREQQQTGGAGFTAVVDPQRAQALSTARTKRDEHARKATRFTAYAEALSVPGGDRSMTLTIDDVDYFGMHRPEGE